ncbi:hypothetical protein CHLRE_12g498750v5 [Chlamydomonas reinhardtii]|uniref:Partial AB-hydrolase lipase domain-containing protein n=1 Tax=Chlamydomonas reinhardtii TaxID=3055 RepID=A0A2K3D3D3_CHLRE|nr:uncharacterized protein CHLRE_12g498750v5 [Chlamydomonas reinhardtii]PNW75052.1 hypothetical protein CHLRE_12g498750v5 [Chlamydomonas reinhardtii]
MCSAGRVHVGALLRALVLLQTFLFLHAQPDNPEIEHIRQLVAPFGYPLQVHTVQTEDGFLLTLLRMPNGKAAAWTGPAQQPAAATDGGADSPRPVVLLQHGLLDSAAGYLVNGPERSLAFILADEGYDVWLGNVRGNSLSRAHVSLAPEDAAFWMWSYDEMAAYDMPAMVRYILRASGAASLRYVGHSQGTTVLLAALAGPMAGQAAAEPPLAEVAQATQATQATRTGGGCVEAEQARVALVLAADAGHTGRAHLAEQGSAVEQSAADEAEKLGRPGAGDMDDAAHTSTDSSSRRSLRAVRSRGQVAGARPGRVTMVTKQHRSSSAAASEVVTESAVASGTSLRTRPRPRAAALAPELIERAALLAPVAVAKHISSVPLLALAAMGTDDMFSLLGLHEFLPSQQLVAALEGALCAVQPALCVSFLAALCGYNPDNINSTRLPLYLSYTPAGTSVQNMAHWAQAVRSRAPNSMSYFDYGTNCASRTGHCNQLEYGRFSPPRYNLTAITTPLALFSGTKDRLSDPLDMEYLMESLAPGVVRAARVLPAYEHLDFIWGIDARDALYDDVLRFLAGDDP